VICCFRILAAYCGNLIIYKGNLIIYKFSEIKLVLRAFVVKQLIFFSMD